MVPASFLGEVKTEIWKLTWLGDFVHNGIFEIRLLVVNPCPLMTELLRGYRSYTEFRMWGSDLSCEYCWGHLS